jgi:NAD+ kinase
MIIGITGNTSKDQIWAPIERVVRLLRATGRPFGLNRSVARGLTERSVISAEDALRHAAAPLAEMCDVILSFGGDGTLLNTAHAVGASGTPILGVNLGRLGFLASLEESNLQEALAQLEAGDYSVESRFVLEAAATGFNLPHRWALNEFVIQRPSEASLLAIDVTVDGTRLNTYWADGLIMATPTGSTAYSLAVGGPIALPSSESIIMTPLAPHTLTVRPVVLPGSVVIQASILGEGAPFVFTSDGRGTVIEDGGIRITVKRASHTVNLIQLPGYDYFQTLRSKLMWGARKV